ncbi:unnamed protein product [Mycena citricolor]|uniref:Fungal lipase-type domain-containing protein n=1 Tax=Mycena citricolor TaxID=2018698 RepID=A0AAD2HKK0_9AGAR|nr:unnamed protein product [Mycena citricolor]
MAHRLTVLAVLGLSLSAAATPLAERQATSITALSQAQIDFFTPYSYYAAAAYCPPQDTLAWNCTVDCLANPGFKPLASGGDGNGVQYWYVGYDPALKTVIVGHQGTGPDILAILTDANFFMESLNATLFPGIPAGIQAHSGFANEHAKTAETVLANVKRALSITGFNKVTMVGHSLGAAISLLDAAYLPLHLTGVKFQSILYGMPRVGNQAFAEFVSVGNTITHVNNREDLVPILPGRFLGYRHPTGEIHIQDSGAWLACPGMDNNSTLCTTGDVPTLLQGNTSDHTGPYNGILIHCVLS